MPTTIRPMCLSVPEVCSALRIGKTTVYKLIRDGRLSSIKIGSSTRITSESVEALLPRPNKGGDT